MNPQKGGCSLIAILTQRDHSIQYSLATLIYKPTSELTMLLPVQLRRNIKALERTSTKYLNINSQRDNPLAIKSLFSPPHPPLSTKPTFFSLLER
jgi:hypothetical protein